MPISNLMYFGTGNVVDIEFLYDFGPRISILREILEDIEDEIYTAIVRGGKNCHRANLLRKDLARGRVILKAVEIWTERQQVRKLKKA